MKVHELISKLERMPAGAEVFICQLNARTDDCDNYTIDDVNGGDLSDETFIGNVYLDKGAKQ
jgi:hypothetical protein